MKTIILLGSFLAFVALDSTTSSKPSSPKDWVEESTSQDATTAAAAQAHLRDAGPSGLQMLFDRYAPQIAAHRAGAPSDEQWKRIATALDKVGGQHDNYASGLYWYTDLEKAKAAAQTSGRPILSLRLLGRLDEDLSCANSRFFRTTLYPNAQINEILKNRYILHWESFRPAPRVTIDFGDGRKLERTITGNSIHYILNTSGRVVDALPGLYSAPVFAEELRQAADDMQRPGLAAAHLEATRGRLLAAWARDLTLLGVNLPARREETDLEERTNDALWQEIVHLHEGGVLFDRPVSELMMRKFPTAQDAVPLAATKSAVEIPLLNSFTAPDLTSKSGAYPSAQVAAPVSLAKSLVEVPMLRGFAGSPRVNSLGKTIALDTVENNYLRRTKILAYLKSPAGSHLSLKAINNWVYSKVFLTPAEDPWLGLAPQDVFSGIEGDGRIVEKTPSNPYGPGQ